MSWINKNPVVGSIDTRNEGDWYKVELKEFHYYQIDIRGKSSWDYFNLPQVKDKYTYRRYAPNVELTLSDPFLYGIYDPEGNQIPRTTEDWAAREVM